MSGVEIVIDELVVRGLRPEDARRVAADFEERLTALARAGGVVAHGRPVRSVSAGIAGIGAEAATAVWASLTGGRTR
ncbi:MAG: hypothetical protein ABI990_00340 [Actinomycetota bacterium]